MDFSALNAVVNIWDNLCTLHKICYKGLVVFRYFHVSHIQFLSHLPKGEKKANHCRLK